MPSFWAPPTSAWVPSPPWGRRPRCSSFHRRAHRALAGRKAICWWAAFVARVTWLGVLVVPWAVPCRREGRSRAPCWRPPPRHRLGRGVEPVDPRLPPRGPPQPSVRAAIAIATTIGACAEPVLAGLAVEELGSSLGSAFGGYVVVPAGRGRAARPAVSEPDPEPAMPPATHRPWRHHPRAPQESRVPSLVAFWPRGRSR